MLKATFSRGKLNGSLALGGLLGAAIPIIAVAATGGLAAVPMTLWLGLGGAVSALCAGNVELKSDVDRALDREMAQAGKDE